MTVRIWLSGSGKWLKTAHPLFEILADSRSPNEGSFELPNVIPSQYIPSLDIVILVRKVLICVVSKGYTSVYLLGFFGHENCRQLLLSGVFLLLPSHVCGSNCTQVLNRLQQQTQESSI